MTHLKPVTLYPAGVKRWPLPLFLLILLTFFLSSCTDTGEQLFTFTKARWEPENARLVFSGVSVNVDNVTIVNSNTAETVASEDFGLEGWQIEVSSPDVVPCKVKAVTKKTTLEKDVENAPADCDLSLTLNTPFKVLAANDLGMHCADLDYRIFSILPPFNVVHAQVIERGVGSTLPAIRDDSDIKLTYHATSNEFDPVLTTEPVGPTGISGPSINTTSQNINGIYKSNFSEDSGIALPAGTGTSANQNYTLGGRAYSSLYPGVQVIGSLGGSDLSGLCDDPATLFGCPSALTLFEPLGVNTGIPVPSPSELYPADPLASPLLVTGQQHMPGSANVPQEFDRFDRDLPFFTNFDFGYRGKELNWFAADGIPMMPVDDAGRSNAYPMMRIVARDAVSDVAKASVDIVLPVASEADCQNCHVEAVDCLDPQLPANVQTAECLGAGVTQTAFNVMTLDDNPPGETRLQQLLNTAKINILRLHDVKHGASYQNWAADKSLVSMSCDLAADASDPNCLSNQAPIQCSQCHYSPALDLTQAGPVNEPEQGLKGRQQQSHISMSRAMHGHHGTLPDFDAGDGNGAQPLFPAMPGPIGRSDATTADILSKTCYQCHPGKRTQCLRGAMATGGVVCQDCHGDMEQVGNDFTIRVSSHNPADFVLDGSLRVPWASVPGCQSCHTGDANKKNHPPGALVAADGIRLLQAYADNSISVPGVSDPVKVATRIESPTSRFAENQAQNSKGDTVDVLYRLSKGHGGVMCEGCHNSTHAIWPIQNPFANDNVASNQIQGHSGTVIECTACHDAAAFEENGDLSTTLDGPHGMHPVGNTRFVENHEDIVEKNRNHCRACHGQNGEGSVLSRMADTRTLTCKGDEGEEGGDVCKGAGSAVFAKGHQVTCHDCHENEINGD